MRVYHELRAVLEWYRALRSLHRILGLVTALALIVSSSGCAGSGAPTAPAGSAESEVRLANEGRHGIWFVRARRCGATQWSADLLASEVVTAGMTRTFRLSPGCTDLRVETTTALGGHNQWDSLELRPGEAVPLTLERWTFTRNVGAGAPESDTP